MRHALHLPVLVCLAAACGDPGPTTCSTDTDFDCQNVCEHMKQLCDEGCGGSDPSQCGAAGCVESCELFRKDPQSIPGDRKELVLGNFNCADDNDTCGNYAGCVTTCFTSNPD